MKDHGDQAVAIIVASGEILDGEHSPGTVGGDSLATTPAQGAQGRRHPRRSCRIDSPGGSIMASEVDTREVAALRRRASRSWPRWARSRRPAAITSRWTRDKILAAPTTITVSIGVFAVIPTFQRTLDKIGITNDGFGTPGSRAV
jgi:protease-4